MRSCAGVSPRCTLRDKGSAGFSACGDVFFTIGGNGKGLANVIAVWVGCLCIDADAISN